MIGVPPKTTKAFNIYQAAKTDEIENNDKRIIQNLTGLKNINTPLYNSQNPEDESKINTIIKNNFDYGSNSNPPSPYSKGFKKICINYQPY
ncbi:MAG: hypothetical protein DRQ51_02565 [Gammaproteobacteria bacterium]|nr:MAG: hypothetical protein DRQ51_02565 [Gammaproteobacteria bacterium]